MKMEKRGQETLRKSFNKRGQVTMFIILGILIVIIAGALLFVNRDKITTRGVSSAQIEPIRAYMDECITTKLKVKMNDLRKYGGKDGLYTVPGNPFSNNVLVGRDFNMDLFPYKDIEMGIASDISNYLRLGSCDLSLFKNNFEIIEDRNNLRVSVNIHVPSPEINEKSNIIEVTVNYPIEIRKGDFSVKIDDFNIFLKDDFGETYYVVKKLLTEYTIYQPINSFTTYCVSTDEISKFNYICPEQSVNGWKKVWVGNPDKFPIGPLLRDFSLEGEIFEFVVKER